MDDDSQRFQSLLRPLRRPHDLYLLLPSQYVLASPCTILTGQLHSVNEILVEQESREAEYEARALKLLEDESLLYLVIIARDAALQTVTVRMGEAVKRKRYKQSGEELQTYLDMEPGYVLFPLPWTMLMLD